MTLEELRTSGIVAQPLLAVIRAKCLDCVGDNAAEVRRCGDIKCPNWAYRMSANPFRAKRQLTEAQRVALNRGRAAEWARYYPGEIETEPRQGVEPPEAPAEPFPLEHTVPAEEG
jgi:hypothetical protein